MHHVAAAGGKGFALKADHAESDMDAVLRPGITHLFQVTHSLEVASVGRSIAKIVSKRLCDKYGNDFLYDIFDIDTIVSAACLAHDLGNPPFGHSGEETISSYFKEGNGKDLESLMPAHQWSDLVSFEGNANAFRQLTHQFAGRRQGGMSLTYATLATLIKYPYPSYNKKGKKKYNIFHSEIDTFKKVMEGCGIPCLDEESLAYARHPLSYMMEAAEMGLAGYSPWGHKDSDMTKAT